MCGHHQQDTTAPTTPSAATSALEAAAPKATTNSCCDGHVAAAPVVSAQDDVAECPVMAGTPVVKADAGAAGLCRDYEGTRYWLCCAGCDPKWDADPAKYAAA